MLLGTPPLRNRCFTTICSPVVRTVADRDRHSAYHIASAADELSGGTNIDDP